MLNNKTKFKDKNESSAIFQLLELSKHRKPTNLVHVFTAGTGDIAQWDSIGVLIQRPWVRYPGGAG